MRHLSWKTALLTTSLAFVTSMSVSIAPAWAQDNPGLYSGDGASRGFSDKGRATNPYENGDARESNPYGLQQAHSNGVSVDNFRNKPNPNGSKEKIVDRDGIKNFVGQMAGYSQEEQIEESELTDVLDQFEKTYGVAIPNRDVLTVSGLTGEGLTNALDLSLNQQTGGDSGNLSADYYSLPDAKTGIPKGYRVQLPGMKSQSPAGAAATQDQEKLLYRKQASNSTYHASGSQKNYGVILDHNGNPVRARYSRSFGTGQSHYKTRNPRQSYNDPLTPQYTTNAQIVRYFDDKVTEYYSNGQPRVNNRGIEVYPNGKAKFNNSGIELYSNGKPKYDQYGNSLHSNGQKKFTRDGRPLYANGRPKVSSTGVLLFRNGNRKLSGDGRSPIGKDGQPIYKDGNVQLSPDGTLVATEKLGGTNAFLDKKQVAQVTSRPLYVNGREMSTESGVKLHANGNRRYTGDGIGELPTATGNRNTVSYVSELYSNGKRAFSEAGTRFYSNGKARSAEDGVFLFPNGNTMVNDSQQQALNKDGTLVRGSIGPNGRAQGTFSLFDVADLQVVRVEGTDVVVRAKGESDELSLSSPQAVVLNPSDGNQVLGTLAQLAPNMSVRAVFKSDIQFVNGEPVDASSPQAVAFFSDSSKVGDERIADGTYRSAEILVGHVATLRENALVLEGTSRGDQVEVLMPDHTVFQVGTREGPRPTNRQSIEPPTKVTVVAEQNITYKDGRPVESTPLTAIAVLR